jgi:hypothetical protein
MGDSEASLASYCELQKRFKTFNRELFMLRSHWVTGGLEMARINYDVACQVDSYLSLAPKLADLH